MMHVFGQYAELGEDGRYCSDPPGSESIDTTVHVRTVEIPGGDVLCARCGETFFGVAGDEAA